MWRRIDGSEKPSPNTATVDWAALELAAVRRARRVWFQGGVMAGIILTVIVLVLADAWIRWQG